MDVVGDQVDSQGHFPDSSGSENGEIPVPTYQTDLFYNTNHKRRGIAVIFNHEKFHTSLQLDVRYGTKADCKNLEEILQTLGFEITRHDDLNLQNLTAEIKKLSETDFSDCDCLFMVVLSHGHTDCFYAQDSAYSPNILFDPFTPDKCPSLAGKPKLFIFQTCRGKKFDDGVSVRTVEVDSGHNHSKYRIPLYADFLMAYATIPGYYSWRNTGNGSWFIQALCQELKKYWKEYDFMTILTFAIGRVAYDFESYCPKHPSEHRKKQIPCVITQLTRLLHFIKIKANAICNDGL